MAYTYTLSRLSNPQTGRVLEIDHLSPVHRNGTTRLHKGELYLANNLLASGLAVVQDDLFSFDKIGDMALCVDTT